MRCCRHLGGGHEASWLVLGFSLGRLEETLARIIRSIWARFVVHTLPERLSLHGDRSQPRGDPGVALTASEPGLCACDAFSVWFRQQVDGMVYIRVYMNQANIFWCFESSPPTSAAHGIFIDPTED